MPNDIIEIQPGQSVDAVESLALALVETMNEAIAWTEAHYPESSFVGDTIDVYPKGIAWVDAFRREHARLLLERMTR